MSILKLLREETVALLKGAGWENVYAYSPEKFSPPLAYVLPGTPYLTSEGTRYGHKVMNLEVRLVIRGGNNQTQTDNLDAEIVKAIAALEDSDLSVLDVSQPYSLLTENGSFTAVTINVSQTIVLGE